jgi:integrase
MRTEELARLTWADVDLVHNRLDLDENKTDRPRSWDMRPDVVAALKVWRERFRPKEDGDKDTDKCVLVDDHGTASTSTAPPDWGAGFEVGWSRSGAHSRPSAGAESTIANSNDTKAEAT